jgi:hypothetical protein
VALPQIGHATNHSASDRARTGQETTQKQDDRACVSLRFRASHNDHADVTGKKADRSTNKRTGSRATHDDLISKARDGTNDKKFTPSSFVLQSNLIKDQKSEDVRTKNLKVA